MKTKSNHLLHKEDFAPRRRSGNSFTDTETNIVLLIILVVILMLFWMPLSELIR